MIDALQTATTGMTRATDRFGNAAQRVADIGVPAGDAALPPAAQVDLSSTVADLIESVARTADRMSGQLLDIKA
jgi:hypothetical protein